MTRLRSMGAPWPPGGHDDFEQVATTEGVQSLPSVRAERAAIEKLIDQRDRLRAELTSVEQALHEAGVESG